jgi:hypothetical protein
MGVLARLVTVGKKGTIEGVTEATQELISELEVAGITGTEARDLSEKILTAFAAGGFSGGVVAAAISAKQEGVIGKPKPETTEPTKDITPKEGAKTTRAPKDIVEELKPSEVKKEAKEVEPTKKPAAKKPAEPTKPTPVPKKAPEKTPKAVERAEKEPVANPKPDPALEPTEQLLPDKVYDDIAKTGKGSIIQQVRKGAREFKDATKQMVVELGQPISTRIRNISRDAFKALRKFEFDVRQQTKKDIEAVFPLFQATKRMAKEDKLRFDIAQKNGDIVKIEQLLKKYNAEDVYEGARETLNSIYDRLIAVGYDVGFLPNYFPRIIKDTPGLLTHLYNTEARGQLREAIKEREKKLGRNLSEEEQAEMANNLIRGYADRITLAKPGATKERKIEFIDTPELNSFYFDSNTALLTYITRMNEAIARRKFFGKALKNKTPLTENLDVNMDDINSSIDEYVSELIRDGKIAPAKENELISLLRSRFGFKPTTGLVSTVKNAGYITSMGINFTSTLTQIGDLSWAFATTDAVESTKALGRSITRKSAITPRDIGIERIAQEFADITLMGKAVENIFKATGLTAIDFVGKETLINSTLNTMAKQAQRGKLKPRFQRLLNDIFDAKTQAEVLENLKKGNFEDQNVKFLAFNNLLDFQPVALSEVPQKYLDSPNGRIFYMLKTFTIKQIDVFNRNGIKLMRSPNRAQKAEGVRNLTKLAAVFMLLNATADELKDMITGRSTQFSDRVWDNVLRLVGISKYITWSFRRYGVRDTIFRIVAFPVNWIEDPARDIDNVITKVQQGNSDDINIYNLETWRDIPVIGGTYYYWFGNGKVKEKQRQLARILDEAKKKQFNEQEIMEFMRHLDFMEIDEILTFKERKSRERTFLNNQTIAIIPRASKMLADSKKRILSPKEIESFSRLVGEDLQKTSINILNSQEVVNQVVRDLLEKLAKNQLKLQTEKALQPERIKQLKKQRNK